MTTAVTADTAAVVAATDAEIEKELSQSTERNILKAIVLFLRKFKGNIV